MQHEKGAKLESRTLRYKDCLLHSVMKVMRESVRVSISVVILGAFGEIVIINFFIFFFLCPVHAHSFELKT